MFSADNSAENIVFEQKEKTTGVPLIKVESNASIISNE